ncbi:TPA: type IV secretion system DNA-binding domain-containing protein [Stenotrophomonas maltophilia]
MSTSAPTVQTDKVVNILGHLPQSLSPSDYVRRIDHALIYGSLIGGLAFCTTDGLLASTLASNASEWWLHARGMAVWDQDYRELLRSMGTVKPMVYGAMSYAVGLATGFWVGKRQLTPYNHERHIDGDRVWTGAQAIHHVGERARLLSEGDKAWTHIHPSVPIPKTLATRGMLIVGGVGGGKSVVLKQMIDRCIRKKRRCLMSDIKGDYTEMYASNTYARIFSLMDKRSVKWAIAQDLNTLPRAAAFFNGLVGNTGTGEENEEGRLWRNGPASVMTGVAYGLMQRKPLTWTFTDLATAFRMGADELHAFLNTYFPAAARFVEDPTSKTTQSILQSLTDYAGLVEKFAMAWPDHEKRGEFSWRKWLTDNTTRQRHIIMQATDDKHTTAQIFAAVFNYMAGFISDGEVMKDDEKGRTLCFYLDELPQFGRFAIDTFVTVGRSKGFVPVLVVQDLAQLEQVYGEKTTTTLLSSIAIKLYCWIEGDTAKRVAEGFGYKRIANLLPQYSNSKDGTSSTMGVKEEGKAVCDPHLITNGLGKLYAPKTGKPYGIRAMLRLSGGDAYVLDWRFHNHPKDSPARISADWTHAPLPEKTWRELHGIYAPPHEDALQACRDMVALFDKHAEAIAARRAAQTKLLNSLRETHLGVTHA